MGIFQSVKVGFLVFGHTHDHINQMFIRFLVTLKRENVGSLPSLIECIKKAYIPEPVFPSSEDFQEGMRMMKNSSQVGI